MNAPLRIKTEKPGAPERTQWVEVPSIWITSALAVHPEVEHDTESSKTSLLSDFVVCHTPTGLKMASSPHLECAINAAKAFAALPVDWEKYTKADFANLPDETRGAIKVIRAAASVGGEIIPPPANLRLRLKALTLEVRRALRRTSLRTPQPRRRKASPRPTS